ncbi:MAG: hypothetical protein MZV70_15935 [Desulfobacterales bacterium]|nr:hypothetical protein [Desulfobacterales bacterium]
MHESFLLVGLPLVLIGAVLRPGTRHARQRTLLPFVLPASARFALWASETFLLDRASAARPARDPPVGLLVRRRRHEPVRPRVADHRARWRPGTASGTPSGVTSQTRNLLRLMVPSAVFLVLAAALLSPAGARMPPRRWPPR